MRNMRHNFKWMIVGALTVVLDFSLFIILHNSTSSVLFSNLIAGVFSTSINFILHRYWTFQSDLSTRILLAHYLFLVMFLFVVGSISTYILIIAGISTPISKGVSIGLNLLLSRIGTWKVFWNNQ
jgi:putative flippase GtrA